MKFPLSGPYYSLNEAREPEWPEGLKKWINDAKAGAVPHANIIKYSSRYVCSLCPDVHRSLLKGGYGLEIHVHVYVCCMKQYQWHS